MNIIQKVGHFFQVAVKRFHDITKMGGDYSSFPALFNTRSDYLSEYKGWVFAAVSLIASRVAGLNYHLLDEKGKPVQHEYLNFITYDLLEAMASFMKLNGTCYVWTPKIGGRIIGCNILRPDIVQPEYSKDRAQILRYSYSVNGKKFYFKKEEVIAIHNFNPHQKYPFVSQGVGDVQAAGIAIDTDNAASTWNWKFFENNAAPGFGLATDGKLDDTTYQRVKASWENKYKGVNNAHKVAIFEGGLKPVNISPSQREMDFVETRRYSRDEILAIFKVPKAALGLGEGSGQNLNITAFEIQLAKNAIQPLAIKIQEALSIGLFGYIGRFEFVNVIPKDAEEVRRDFEVGGITLNEFRTARGYNLINNGDIFKDNQMPTITIGKPEPKKSSKYEGLVKSIILKNTKGTEENAQDQWEKRQTRLQKHEGNVKTALMKAFDKQEKDILSRIKKDFKTDIPQLDTSKYQALYLSLLKETYLEIYTEEGNVAMEQIAVDTAFKVGDKEVREIKDTIANFGKNVDTTTNQEIRETLAQAIDAGEDVSKMIARLQVVFTALKEQRLETIARTETITASTNATLGAWRQSKVVEGKQWWTAKSERTCKYCGAMHGKTIGIDENFFEKGDTFEVDKSSVKFDYRDINGPSLHPNCLCTLIPIIKKS